MSLIGEKERLVSNVVQLRRAERACPASEEIEAVRGDLERRIGPTVTRAQASRLLGVSQTAFDRWIGQGDISVVITPSGRREVPVHALLDLIEDVEDHSRTHAERYPLASVLQRRRAEAQQLELGTILPTRYRRRGGEHGHRPAELRALAYHRAVAQRLDAWTVKEALHRLRRWRSERKIDPRYADQWEEILSWPLPRISRLISQDSERARALRQSSPFAGVLHERERQRVLDAVG